MNNLIPFYSTHIQYVGTPSPGLTPGGVYSIIKWEKRESGNFMFRILDDDGDLRSMILKDLEDIDRSDFEDCSFEKNLKLILE